MFINSNFVQLSALEATSSADDALRSYDPYGTNVYKGVQLSSDQAHAEIETITRSGDALVAFKKRKRSGNSIASAAGGGSSGSGDSIAAVSGGAGGAVTVSLDTSRFVTAESKDQQQQEDQERVSGESVPPTRIKLEPNSSSCSSSSNINSGVSISLGGGSSSCSRNSANIGASSGKISFNIGGAAAAAARKIRKRSVEDD
jgi:hypothetical protein